MLWWALVFFILAIVAAIFGFGGFAAGLATAAQIIFYAALVFFVITFIMHLAGGRGGGRRTASP